MSRRRCLEIAYAVSLLVPGVAAAEQELPDVEFLEFLGSWEGADDDWLELMELARARELEKSGEKVSEDTEAVSDE